MNYIIFDLEFNQQHPDMKNTATPNLMFEIIQIGALKLDNNFNTISTFNAFIKPTVHKILHPYVEDLTNITYEQLNTAKIFIDVYSEFINFIGNSESTLVLWGVNDIKELIKNIHYYKLSSDIIPKNYIDIQSYLSKILKYPKGKKIGLKTAIEHLEIPINYEFHDAFNDAYYTTEIFKKIYNKGIKAQLYIHTNNKREKLPKKDIDTLALIKQFEKMYNRSITTEEKDMIKLAYMMGKTNQFNK